VGEATYAVDGTAQDISRSGCGIRGTMIPPVGSKTRLALYLPDQKVPLSLDARIIRVAGNYFGVEFTGMKKDDYARIRRYMM
jgi:hypothetical protein